jgi:1-acyl-sn-glycerol-3-phosphate acyltransferase
VCFLIPAISVDTIVLGTLSVASSFFDRRVLFAHGCARLWARLILRSTGVRVRARGLEHLDLHASYLVASNHQSIYDIPVLFDTLPLQLRSYKGVARQVPFMAGTCGRTGHLLVQRENPGAGILERMKRLVGDQVSLIVFPEGTRSRDGRLARFKGGPFRIAVDSGLPIVPVSVSGTRHVMLKGRLMTCPGDVEITVHAPVPTAGLAGADVRQLADRVRAIVETAVVADGQMGALRP